MKLMNGLMQQIISLCKRRGFIYPGSEIYGGFSSGYDFGPLGVEMKNNIKKCWWDEMTKKQNSLQNRIVGLDSAILMSPLVWQASGHLTAGFADELVECKACHHRFRKDFLKENKCPDCKGELTGPRKFNLMMKTFIGSVEDKAALSYLRAETCQGIYLNFLNVLNSMRLKLPFGIVQIGKSFRNEITPGNFIFRTREFEQMEMQWFCRPEEADRYFNYWKEQRMNWYFSLGIKKENLRTIEVPPQERAHYARKQVDIEYKFPFGWQEIEGIHNRGDWDLRNHSRCSKHELKYQGYYPYIIETSVGADRSFLAFLIDAYQEISGGRSKTVQATKEKEIVLKFHPVLAPIKVAVLPLLKNKPAIVDKAAEIYQLLKNEFNCLYDETGSIGRRYRRMDEIGCPFAITVDFESLEQNDVTLRQRDSMAQSRVPIKDLPGRLSEQIKITSSK